MSTLDVRPGKLSVRFRPSNAVVLELAWPSGVLDDRTFAATLGISEDNELDVVVVGDVMTITATADQTEAVTTWARWALVETTTGEDQEVITGRWTASLNGTQSPDDTVTVALDEATVTVTVLGPPGPEGPPGEGGEGGTSDHGALTGLSDPDHPIAAVVGLQAALDAKATAVALTAESAARTGADASEATTRANADTALDGRLDTIEAISIATDAELASAVAAEATLARNADNLTSGTVADARVAATIARDSEVTAAVAAEAVLARNADNLTSGTVADARIAASIARDSEVTSAVSAEATARDVAIAAAIANLIDSSPGALDTLNELAAALGDDPNFATTITNALATKESPAGAQAKVDAHVNDTTDAHDASAISIVPPSGLTATNAQALWDEYVTGANAAFVDLYANKQPLDADLTAIAALTPTNDDFLQRKAGAWVNRTPAQSKADLALAKGDVGLGNVDNTADTAKPVSTAQQTALDLKANLAGATFTGEVIESAGVKVSGARTTLLNNAKSMLLVDDPADDEVNGIVFKFREAAYVAQDYGEGQPWMLLNDGDGDVQTNVFANGTISAASNATPIVLTVNAVGTVVTGDVIFVYGVLGNTAANGWHKVTKVDSTHFSLDGVAGNGAYTSGGAWYCNRSPVLARMDWPGALGLAAPIHLAVGIRGVSGFAGYGPSDPALWIDQTQDTAGIAIHNPSASELTTTPTGNFFSVNDIWNTGNERALFKIGADGTVTIRPKFGRAGTDILFRVRADDDASDTFDVLGNGSIVGVGTCQFVGFTSTGANVFTTTVAATNVLIVANSNASPTGDLQRWRSNSVTKLTVNGTGNLVFAEGVNLLAGTTTGTQIATTSSQKLGFFGATPVVRPAGVAVTAAGIHAALVTLGLIAA